MTGMNFLDSIRKGLDRASFETDKLMRYNRVHAETARLRLEAAEKTRQLGDRVLALYKAGNLNTGDMSLLAREIVDLQTRAQQKEDEATLIQAEVWVEPLDGSGTGGIPVYHAPDSSAAGHNVAGNNGAPYPSAVTPTPVWPASPPPATHWTPPVASPPPPAPPAPHKPSTHLEDQGTRRVSDPRKSEQQEYCPNCGGPLRPHAAFCAQCGIRL